MTGIDDRILNIIREAIRLEINGRRFFEHAENITGKALGKKMFKKLANDEIRHLKEFSQLFSSVLGSDDWQKYVSQEETGSSSLIQELKDRIANSEKEKGAGELEALRIGMELERSAIDFFHKASRETAGSKASEICQEISEEEKFHYDLLQAQVDSVSNSGFWLDVAEFQMDGKY